MQRHRKVDMPLRSELTKDFSGRKQKVRPKSGRRRKSGARRRCTSAEYQQGRGEAATPGGDPDDAHASLFIEGTDAIRKVQLSYDVRALVSPDTYRHYTDHSLQSRRDHGAYSVAKSVPNFDRARYDDGDSVCSVSSYTRSRIENIVKNPDILDYADSSLNKSSTPNYSERSEAPSAGDPETSTGKTEEYQEGRADEVGKAADPDLSIQNECDLAAQRKTLEWVNSTATQRVSRDSLDTTRQTKRILLHIPQANSDKSSGAIRNDGSAERPDHSGGQLSVVVTNGSSDDVPRRHSSTARGAYRPYPGDDASGSRDRRPASARERAQQRHAELQRQSEELLMKKKAMMDQFRLKRWVPIVPETIAIDDLIVINTIRKEMHQGSNQSIANKFDNGFKGPHMATNYDVDSEHQYIMDKALRSYREHRANEPDAEQGHGLGQGPGQGHGEGRRTSTSRRVQSATPGRSTLHVSVPCLTSSVPAHHVTAPHAASGTCPAAGSAGSVDVDADAATTAASLTSRRPSTAQPRLADVRHRLQPTPLTSQNPVRRPTSQNTTRTTLTTTSYNADIRLANNGAPRRVINRSLVPPSMDKSRLNKGAESKRQGQGHGHGQGRGQVEGSFFSSTRPKRQYFSIHPEWVSENFSVQSMNISQRMNNSSGAPSTERRCYSAPPPRTRNPITWENPDINELRLRDTRLRANRGRPTTRPKSEVMDAIGSGSDREQKLPKFNIRSTFFSTTNSPRRQYFTIHPEWQSESGHIRKVVYPERTMTYPPRRCKSAPPPRTRNPITWDNADRPDRR